ncbi:SRPBCC family protein [Demequina sp.]|uniref:SRPBCC family protein n=1 Tax=Demequina sp. TaxID=2050685 RepID=UPI003D1489BA
MTIAHHSFTIARTYPHSPQAVFEMFSDPKKKAMWFGNHDNFTTGSNEWDFRVGGRERAWSDHGNGITTTFDATYADIVPGQRIVYTYVMTLNDEPLSGSATSITFEPVEGGTLMTFTEHGIHLDGAEGGEKREEGTGWLVENIGKALDELAASS